MQDRLKGLLTRLKEWWGKFTIRQKTLIVSISAAVLVAITVFIWSISSPRYEVLAVTENTKQTSEIKKLLDDEGYDYQISDDGYTIRINSTQLSDANILLGANDIPTAGYDLSSVFDGGFSTTESDKQKKYQAYLQSQIEKDLENQENIDRATVNLSITKDDGTLLAQDAENYASVMLSIKDKDAMTDDVAASLARFVATAIGNDSTANVVIMDTEGNMLFSGEDDGSGTGNASNRLSYKTKYDNLVKNEIRNALVGAKIYDNVQVVPNLNLNWANVDRVEHTYTPAEGQDQGVLSHRDTYSQTAENTNGQVPGTDTNGDNTYVYADNGNSTTTTDENSSDYLPNETITTTKEGGGAIQYDTSSIGITAISYIVYNEDEMTAQGLLDGITFDEFKAQNSDRVKTEVDEDVVNMVAAATGIPAANISIVAYNEPVFVPTEDSGITWQNYLLIGLIVLILGLLAFVVIRSMRSDKALEEQPEEIQLGDLLQSTQEAALQDISAEDKSEARLLIERFVDENPEAAANLLRNWLSEDWG
ncbi:MAG: flagellar M-ring protein FliF [Lachnospiraceae bacterium]|nr:flagellar M-ring protein FliF [Lachnospiraceae bacterium]